MRLWALWFSPPSYQPIQKLWPRLSQFCLLAAILSLLLLLNCCWSSMPKWLHHPCDTSCWVVSGQVNRNFNDLRKEAFQPTFFLLLPTFYPRLLTWLICTKGTLVSYTEIWNLKIYCWMREEPWEWFWFEQSDQYRIYDWSLLWNDCNYDIYNSSANVVHIVEAFYELTTSCWQSNRHKRPTFEQVATKLAQISEELSWIRKNSISSSSALTRGRVLRTWIIQCTCMHHGTHRERHPTVHCIRINRSTLNITKNLFRRADKW